MEYLKLFEDFGNKAKILEDIFVDLCDKHDHLSFTMGDSYRDFLRKNTPDELVFENYIIVHIHDPNIGFIDILKLFTNLVWWMNIEDPKRDLIYDLKKSPFFIRINELTGYNVVDVNWDFSRVWITFKIENE